MSVTGTWHIIMENTAISPFSLPLNRLTLTATRAGHYNLSILLNGAAIGTGKPARLTVLAAEPDAAGTQLAAAVAPAAAGSPAAILFRPFDRFKNLCTSSALAFTLTAACTQPAVTVQGWVVADAEEQGLYRGTFTATAAGVYTVRIAVQPAVGAEANSSSSSISSGGASLLSVLLTVAAGPPLPYRSTARGAGLWAAAVGLPSNFSVGCLATWCSLQCCSYCSGMTQTYRQPLVQPFYGPC